MDKDYYITSTLGKRKDVDKPNDIFALDYWKSSLYYPVIDSISANFEYRFKSIPLAKSVNAFMNLNLENAQEFINNYKELLKINSDSLNAEALVMKSMLENITNEKSFNLETFKDKVDKNIYPNIYKLLQVGFCLPISSAGCERSFSAMRRIKTWLRSTMEQKRF